MADTDLTQLVINVGTTAQIEAGVAGGTITENMLSVSTDGDTYIQGVKVNGTELTPDSNNKVDVSVPTESTVSGWGFTKNIGTVTSVNNVSPVNGNVTITIPDPLPNQTGNSGKYLTTNGTTASWGAITIPTVNNPTITITQGGVTKGSFTLNQAAGDTIALDAGGGGGSYTAGTGIDITNDVISVTSPTLTNTATGTNSLTILGYATSQQGCVNIGIRSATNNSTFATAVGANASIGNNAGISVAIGSSANVTSNSQNATAIGGSSNCRAERTVAIGYGASARASNAIQLGYGTNSESNSFYVSTSLSNNWKMLGSDGKIPSGRLPIATSVSSSSTNDETVGAKLFYDTCGDIETAINTIRGV